MNHTPTMRTPGVWIGSRPEMGELVEDDGDGKRYYQDAPQDAARGCQLARHCHRHHVPIAHGGHAHCAPPPAGGDGVEAHVLLLLSCVGHTGEHRHTHGQVQQ